MYYEECTIEEVLAYRDLENEYFDFGEGPMKASSGMLSEDAYYEMRIIDEENKEKERNMKVNTPSNTRLNKHANKRKAKRKLKKLYKDGHWSLTGEHSGFIKRYYCKSARYHKTLSDKAIRRYSKGVSNGGNYRRIYDIWWNIY